MSVKCSAKQIADFVAFWGMTETFPEYCEHADDARNLKSLDLIISTLDVFVQAFSSNFENIYRKYKVNFPLSEEKFMEFLKPRCLLLSKDNKCLNFMLVCAFVYDIIHSFSCNNKCFHLVKIASKCLAAILKNKFKRVFETDSGWEELMAFCIKIHGLVYRPAKVSESDGDKLDTDNMDASFLNMSQRLEKLSIEKNVTISDNNDDESDTKMSGKETSKSLMNDPTTENDGKESEDLNSSESADSKDAPHTLHFYEECSSLKSENVPDQNNIKKDNDKSVLTNSPLPALSVVSARTEKLDRIICNEESFSVSFETYLALEKRMQRIADLRNFGISIIDDPQTFQLKTEDFSPEKAEDRSENDSTTDITSVSESTNEISDSDSKKKTINIKEDNEKHDQMNLKNHLTISFDDYLSMKKAIERLEYLCNLALTSKDSSQALQLKIEELYPIKAEHNEKTHDGTDERKKNKECAEDMTDLSLTKATKKFTDNNNEKPVENEKLNESTDLKKNLTISFEDYLAIQKGIGRLEQLLKSDLNSTNTLYTDSSLKEENEEKIYAKNDEIKDNEDCVIMDSSISDLAEDITNTIVDNEDGNTEKLSQMIGFQEDLILLLEKDLAIMKEPETSHLYNLEYDSCTVTSQTFQLKCEDLYPNAESEGVNKNYVKDSNVDANNSLVTDSAHDLTRISIRNKSINKNLKQTLGEMVGCRKKINLPFGDNSNAQDMIKKLEGFQNLGTSSLPDDVSHTLKDNECTSKNDFEENKEPFNIHIMSEDKIRARITENPQHLSEIMDLLKKCEDDIEMNMFSPYEYDMPLYDSDEDEELDARGRTSKSSGIGDRTIFESSIKTIVFTQNMKMAHSIKRIYSEDYQSDDETLPKASGGASPHEITEFSNQTFQSEDTPCSLCADGMVNFFDTCVNNFAIKYSHNDQSTDLFRFDFYEDSE